MKHWKADAQLAGTRSPKARAPHPRALNEFERWAKVDAFELPKAPKRRAERSGALAGLILVATACAGLCFMLYQVSGPRDTFAQAEGPID